MVMKVEKLSMRRVGAFLWREMAYVMCESVAEERSIDMLGLHQEAASEC